MRVTILTVGSRGDVQPYAALAQGLIQAGHAVTLTTHRRFEWLAQQAGVPFTGLEHDPLLMFSRLFTLRALGRPVDSWTAAKRVFLSAMDEWDQAVAGADLLVAHPKVFVAAGLAARHGARVAFANTLPVSCPTAAYPCCYLLGASRGARINRLSYRLLAAALSPLKGWAVEWFAARGTTRMPRGRWDLYANDRRPIAHLHGYSATALAAPADWPPEWKVTGYWRMTHPVDWSPPTELGRFLLAGPPPVYVGFGSMVYRGDRRQLTRQIVQPFLDRGERILLVRGWALDDSGLAGTEGVYFMDAYEGPWHSWLFAHVQLVVHHGGPGTFGAALHAGRAQLCCPFAMDQPFWALRAEALGVAPKPIPMRQFSAKRWESLVHEVLQNRSYADAASSLAQRLTDEDGVGAAVAYLEEIVGCREWRPRGGADARQ